MLLLAAVAFLLLDALLCGATEALLLLEALLCGLIVAFLLLLLAVLCDLTAALLLVELLLWGATDALLLTGALLCGATDALLLAGALLCGATDAFRLLLLVALCCLTVALRSVFGLVCGTVRVTFFSLLFAERSICCLVFAERSICCLVLLERSTALPRDWAFLVAGFTDADRWLLLPALLFLMLPLPAALVLELALSTLLFLPVADLLLAAARAFAVRSLDTSGRYTLTALLLTLVDLPERLAVLSNLRTEAFLPVSLS